MQSVPLSYRFSLSLRLSLALCSCVSLSPHRVMHAQGENIKRRKCFILHAMFVVSVAHGEILEYGNNLKIYTTAKQPFGAWHCILSMADAYKWLAVVLHALHQKIPRTKGNQNPIDTDTDCVSAGEQANWMKIIAAAAVVALPLSNKIKSVVMHKTNSVWKR